MILNIHTMNNINDLDISLLGFLCAQPMHGYELHKQVTDLSGFGIVWRIKIGKLYAMLGKLEKEGFIKSTFAKEGNRPARNEFSITSTGEKIFDSWVVFPVNHGRDFRTIFLLKLYFALRIGVDCAKILITSQNDACNSWLSERMIQNQEDLLSGKTNENSFQRIVNKYRQIQIQGYLEWLEWCKESLKRG